MNIRPDQTIFALSSAAGRAGVAVIRISGTLSFDVVRQLTGRDCPPRVACLCRLVSPTSGETLDRSLVVCFPGPHSFTGEDVAEFHVHGGAAVIESVLVTLGEFDGLRLAEAGEFTRRSFDNGKLDLTEVEGLADLIDAETEGQRRQALRQMDGALSRLYEGWRSDLIGLMAQLEAEIDFPDEGDVRTEAVAVLQSAIVELRDALFIHLNDSKRGERLRDGVRVAIIGAPNAGKSSLLNLLARRDAAIVSDIPGTTRDIIEVRLVLAGAPVWVADTAGMRVTDDVIEAEGVRRAKVHAAEADIRIGLVDGNMGYPVDILPPPLAEGDLLLVTKRDLRAATGESQLTVTLRSWAADAYVDCFSVSLVEGDDAGLIEGWLTERVAALTALEETPTLNRARHRYHVQEAIAALDRASLAVEIGAELAGEDLRLAARSLGRIVGRVDVDDLLDKIFADFCIGK